MDMTTKGVIASASSLRKNEIDVFCVCVYMGFVVTRLWCGKLPEGLELQPWLSHPTSGRFSLIIRQ